MPYDVINVEGFPEEELNGSYSLRGYHDGEPFYAKEGFGHEVSPYQYILIYKNQYGPYSFSPSWYIIKAVQNKVGNAEARGTSGRATKIETPRYKSLTEVLLDNQWCNVIGEKLNGTEIITGVV